MLHTASGAQRVLKIRIDLEDFSLELRRANVNKGSGHCLKVGVTVVECYSGRTKWIFVLVRVNACSLIIFMCI